MDIVKINIKQSYAILSCQRFGIVGGRSYGFKVS
jgi:hypothetical protein